MTTAVLEPTEIEEARLSTRQCPNSIRELGAALLSALLLAPEKIEEVRALMDPGDLRKPRAEVLYRRMLALHDAGEPIGDVPLLVSALSDAGELRGDLTPAYVGSLVDVESTAVHASCYARRLHQAHLRETVTYLHEKAAEDPEHAPALLPEIRELTDELAASERGTRPVGFTGDRLRAVREREVVPSPLPELFDPRPGLVNLCGRPMTAKTTFAGALAQAWCCGASPWPDAAKLPGTRALLLSAEQPVDVLDAMLRRMDTCSEEVERDLWTERLTIVARDPDLDPADRALLTLDTQGLGLLRDVMRRQRESGDPFGLVVLDSLSRLKPVEYDENDNTQMSDWLGSLQELAEAEQVYVVLVHHVGHSERDDANNAARGASAIAAVCQTSWLLQTVAADSRQRRIKVQGNGILTREMTFEVAPEDAEPGEVVYWRRTDPLDGYELDELLRDGECISTTELARRIAGAEGRDQPIGTDKRTAASLRHRWQRSGLIDVGEGPRKAVTLTRRTR